MNAVIIDDEPNNRQLLQNMLAIYCKNVNVLATAEGVQSGYSVIQEYEPDVVFLDIQMADGTGFDLLTLFGEINFNVIFTTAFQEYAIKAFQFSAVDYLLKPISPEYLIKAINKLQKLKHSETEIKTLLSNIKQHDDKKIVVKTHDRIYCLNIKDIIRCEADSSYTTIFLQDEHKIFVARQLKEFDEMLSPDGFMRIHQSHLINLSQLFYYQKANNLAMMKDGSAIAVSAKKKEELLAFISSK
jgi:two-component system LytT family response regulator